MSSITWFGDSRNNPILVGSVYNIPIFVKNARDKTLSFQTQEYRLSDQVPEEIEISPAQFNAWKIRTAVGTTIDLSRGAQPTPEFVNFVEGSSSRDWVTEPYRFKIEKIILGCSQEQYNKIGTTTLETFYFVGTPVFTETRTNIAITATTTAPVTQEPQIVTSIQTAVLEPAEEACEFTPSIANINRVQDNPIQARLKGSFRRQQESTELAEGELRVKFVFPNGTVKYADILSFSDTAVEQCQTVINEIREDAQSSLLDEIERRNEILKENEIRVKTLEDKITALDIDRSIDLGNLRDEFQSRIDELINTRDIAISEATSDLRSQINERNTTITTLRDTLNSQSTQISNLTTRLDSARTDLENALSRSEQLAGQLSDAADRSSVLEGKLEDIRQQKADLQGQIGTLQTELSTSRQLAISYENDFKAERKKLNDVKASLSKALEAGDDEFDALLQQNIGNLGFLQLNFGNALSANQIAGAANAFNRRPR